MATRKTYQQIQQEIDALQNREKAKRVLAEIDEMETSLRESLQNLPVRWQASIG